MKIHSDTAWGIASQYGYTLASDTRTLAAQIDTALAEARNDALDEAAKACALEIALSDCPILDDWSEGVEDAMNAILALNPAPE